MVISRIVLSVTLFLITTVTSSAFLGATLEQCVEVYGKVKHTDSNKGQIVRGFLIPDGGLKNVIVFAIFNKEGEVQEIYFKGRTKEKFTSHQISVIFGYNTPDTTNPFVEVGVSPDKSKRMWERADYSAYVVSEENSPAVTLMTREGVVNFFKNYEKE